MRITSLVLMVAALLSACRQKVDLRENEVRTDSSFTEYAEKFDLRRESGYTFLRVFDPWQNSRDVSYGYVLGNDEALVPDSLSAYPFIQTPLSRVIAMSTTHVAMIAALGEAGSIKGASGTAFIYDPEIRQKCKEGLITDVGYGQALNYELLVNLQPQVAFLYGVEGNVTTTAEKLTELGIKVVFCAEYLEPDPLGKAEWIRFFGSFFDREQEADLLFQKVDSNYTALKGLISGELEKPKVMMGLPWKDNWYVAGGKSFASRLIMDAGGVYLWKDNVSAEALPLDLESVFSKAVTADIWINPGAARSIDELVALDKRFADLPVVRLGNIYNNNARMSVGGGNDYWESGTLRPDLVLADLISVFHPQLMRDHSGFYYRKLK